MELLGSLRLENTSHPFNKFYTLSIDKFTDEETKRYKPHKREFVLRATWGRIGTIGTSQEKGTFDTLELALQELEWYATIKREKGYKTKIPFSYSKNAEAAEAKEKAKNPLSPPSKNTDLDRFIDLDLV